MARLLTSGSIVDVVAPAGPFDDEAFRRGIEVLERFGFRPRFRPDIHSRDRFLAGSDDRRLRELQAAMDAPDSLAIWCVRGGYGCTRLLPSLSVESIRRADKVLIGFSDITALHALWWAAGVPSIHGTMVARLAAEPPEVLRRLHHLLTETSIVDRLAGHPLLEGETTGRLAGGNLALLAALCGTPWQPDLEGAVLFLEEVGERPYRVDRMLIQCEEAGLFDGIAGLAVGEFTGCDDRESGITSMGVIEEHARVLNVPTVTALPCGHGAVNQALPFGRRVRLDGTRGRLEFLEPLVG